MRHPAGRARIRPRLRTARRNRLRLSGSHRNVLAAISDELQADAELAAAFSAFTSVTADAAMPKAERRPARSTLAGGRAFLKRRIMLVIIVAAALVTALALALGLALAPSSPGGQTRCDRAYAFAPTCYGPSPAGAGVQASHLPPAAGRP